MSRNLLLGVNIDHCATMRQARYRESPRNCGGIIEPDPVDLALVAERAGADGITAHLREDRRHIQDDDIHRLRACLRTRLNLEMACNEEMTAIATGVRPDSVCLVPENRTEVTTEGGLDVAGQKDRVGKVVESMKSAGIVVSLFIDPEDRQIQAAADLGADCIELHTGAFANAWHVPADRSRELEKLRIAAARGHDIGLIVNAGHGINYFNIADIRGLPWLYELNIGHSILSRSVYTGISEAVGEMKRLMNC